jgi:hypothetical protein
MLRLNHQADHYRLSPKGPFAGQSPWLVPKPNEGIQEFVREFNKPCNASRGRLRRAQEQDGTNFLPRTTRLQSSKRSARSLSVQSKNSLPLSRPPKTKKTKNWKRMHKNTKRRWTKSSSKTRNWKRKSKMHYRKINDPFYCYFSNCLFGWLSWKYDGLAKVV